MKIPVKMIVVSAGMPRTASTFFYNALCIMMKEMDPETVCGWCGRLGKRMYEEPKLVVKIHRQDEALVKRADVVFYSYRDVRDALASHYRIRQRPMNLARATAWIEDDRWWAKRATHLLRYEDFLERPKEVLKGMADVLGYPGEIDDLYDRASAGVENKHRTTNGHGGHKEFPSSELKKVNQRHRRWFRENGYPIT